MKLRELGERKIIEIFEEIFGRCKDVDLGIGDDAAVLDTRGKKMVLSTDMMVQSTHIPKEMTPWQMGNYVVNVNLSDIASMGARPIGMLLSFGLPGELDEEFVREMARGIDHACKEHNICIMGGDTKEASQIIISGTAIGETPGKFLTRSGARQGDLIGVTGKIGSAAAGFYCLVKELKIEPIISERFIKAALEPHARTTEGILLRDLASSCMDISDSLAFSLGEMVKGNNLGYEIHMDKIPVEAELTNIGQLAKVDIKDIVFFKGGDFELVFIVNPDNLGKLEESFVKKGCGFRIIGRITSKERTLVMEEGEKEELETVGYESFKSGIE